MRDFAPANTRNRADLSGGGYQHEVFSLHRDGLRNAFGVLAKAAIGSDGIGRKEDGSQCNAGIQYLTVEMASHGYGRQ
jgi:hypothetical protein